MATPATQKDNLEKKPSKPIVTIAEFFEKRKPEIAECLPEHMTVERLHRYVLMTIQQDPKLVQCSLVSLYAAMINAAQIGLEPGPLQHIAIVPRWANGAYHASLEIMYRGMLELARRSGVIQDAAAYCVYQADEFELVLGDEPHVIHKPATSGDRGAMICAYFVSHYTNGGKHIEHMTGEEIEDIKERFAPRRRGTTELVGPWATDEAEMWRKTVTRRAFKYLPVSIEQQKAIAQDQTIKTKFDRDMASLPDESGMPPIDVLGSSVPENGEEAESAQAQESRPAPEDVEEWQCKSATKATILKLRKRLMGEVGYNAAALTALGYPPEMDEKAAQGYVAKLAAQFNQAKEGKKGARK